MENPLAAKLPFPDRDHSATYWCSVMRVSLLKVHWRWLSCGLKKRIQCVDNLRTNEPSSEVQRIGISRLDQLNTIWVLQQFANMPLCGQVTPLLRAS